MWKLVLLGVATLIVGCAAVEATVGYLGELAGYAKCREGCSRQSECDCTPPSKRK